MGVVFRQSSGTTIVSYIGVVIGYFNVLWLFPAVLTPEEIGLIRLLPSVALVLLPFTQLGLSQGILKFYPQFKDKPGGSGELLSFMLIANTAGFGVTLVLLSLFKDQIQSFFEARSALANQYLHVAAILILIFSYQSIFESFAKSILKIVIPGLVKDVIIRIFYSLTVGLYFFKIIALSTVVNGLIIIYAFALLLLVSYVFKNLGFGLTARFKFIQRSHLIQISRYSLFTLLGASGNYIILNIDQLMISSLIGLEGNGIYTTAFYIAVVIEMPRRAMANITTPLVSQFFQQGKLKEIDTLYKQVSINQMIVGSLILVGILVNLNSVFALVPNREIYIAGMSIVYIIGLAKLLDMVFGINSEIILMSPHYRYHVLMITGLAVFAVISNWYLIGILGIEGAAIATAITLFLFNLTKLLFIKFKLNLWPFRWSNLTVLIIGLATYSIVNLVPFFINIWADILLRSVLVTTLFMTPCFLLKISPEINRVVKQITGMPFF